MKQMPEFKTDAEAEAFLEQDLSHLDFKQFKPIRFEVVKAQAGGRPTAREITAPAPLTAVKKAGLSAAPVIDILVRASPH